MFDKELLKIIICPLCKESVYQSEDEKWLICQKCRRKYPIKENIPTMLIDEAIQDENE